ncbi:MAG: ankyrin repeat domain-containing protein [Rhizomicrobium sp.]
MSWSKFAAAEELLKLGANPNYVDSKGMTALHYMLKKNSGAEHIAVVVRHGWRPRRPSGQPRRHRDRYPAPQEGSAVAATGGNIGAASLKRTDSVG